MKFKFKLNWYSIQWIQEKRTANRNFVSARRHIYTSYAKLSAFSKQQEKNSACFYFGQFFFDVVSLIVRRDHFKWMTKEKCISTWFIRKILPKSDKSFSLFVIILVINRPPIKQKSKRDTSSWHLYEIVITWFWQLLHPHEF